MTFSAKRLTLWLIALGNVILAFGLLKLGQHEYRQEVQLALRHQAAKHPDRATLQEAPSYDPPATLAGYALNAPAASLIYFLGDLYRSLYLRYYPRLVPLSGYVTVWGVDLHFVGDLLYLVFVFLLWLAIGNWALGARLRTPRAGKAAYPIAALGLGALTVATAYRGWSVYTELPFSLAWARHPFFCLALSIWILSLATLAIIEARRAMALL
jgi:hypothetical protein